MSARLAAILGIVGAIGALAPALHAQPSNTILHVDADVDVPGNGTSWTTAFANLRDALNEIASQPGTDWTIWIAEGTYRPDVATAVPTTPDDPEEAFEFAFSEKNIKLIGGFNGAETNPLDRDPAEHITVLTGELGSVGLADNANNVIRVTGTSAVTLQDLVIEAGNARGYGSLPTSGGGIHVDLNSNDVISIVSTEIRDCAADTGGGVGLNATVVVNMTGARSWLHGNEARDGGGLALIDLAAVEVENTLIENNQATPAPAGDRGHGGGIHAGELTKLFLRQCTIAANHAVLGSQGPSASGRGGGLLIAGAPDNFPGISIDDSIFWLNDAGATPSGSPADRLASQINTEVPPAPDEPPHLAISNSNIEESDDSLAPIPPGWVIFPRFDPDPEFVNPTPAVRNFRLDASSPSIDFRDGTTVSDDPEDADRDDDRDEFLPPLAGIARAVDDFDQGAFEFVDCPADLDRNDEVGFEDLLILLTNYGWGSGSFIHAVTGDVDGDQEVGFPDLLVVLTEWGPCGSATGNPPQSITDCIERLGTSDPQTLAACIEAMMRLEEGN